VRPAAIASPPVAHAGRLRDERGQSTIEWTALLLIVALALAFVASLAGLGLPGAALARSIADKIVCVVSGSDECAAGMSDLALAYGPEVAAAISEHVPDLMYEEGMREVPVDFRECREDACAEVGSPVGAVGRSAAGNRATAFVRVIDCRPEPAVEPEPDVDCSGERAGHLYLQFWLYFPHSRTEPWGERGYHRDDFESFQVRIGPPATLARASSHHSYNHDGGPDNWLSDAGVKKKSGWGRYLPTYYISRGSHAGRVEGDPDGVMWTPRSRLVLIPLEAVAAGADADFAVAPPWLKEVWRDPEARGTG